MNHRIDSSFHLFVDFAGSGFVVVIGIGGIFELAGQEGIGITGSQVLGATDGAFHALGVRSASHLGAEGPHDHDFFFRKTFRDEERDLVPAIDTDQGKTDASVAGGRFDDGAAGTQLTVLLRPPNDADGSPILYAAAGVQVFQLGEDIGGIRRSQDG